MEQRQIQLFDFVVVYFSVYYVFCWHCKLQTHTYILRVIQIIILHADACHILGRKKYHLHQIVVLKLLEVAKNTYESRIDANCNTNKGLNFHVLYTLFYSMRRCRS